MCAQVIRKQLIITIPRFLPVRGWTLHSKGYAVYTSRLKGSSIKRGALLHREVIRYLAAEFTPFPLPDYYHVHHQDFNKLNGSPANLIVMPQCLNTTPVKQDPYTGQMISFSEFERRYS